MSVRVRFAPSPTGHLHVGGARTALYNYLFARRMGGTFILRIEDTDAERSTPESIEAIFAGLRWLGLSWDEGPGVDGPHGPYRQSERRARYDSALRRLADAGLAYPAYETAGELDAMREAQIALGEASRYDGRARTLTPAERVALEAGGRLPAWRFRARDEGETGWRDLVRGDVVFPNAVLDDFVLVRSDGLPTYNFACVVDDIDMRITHVVRGDDHISNTPRQLQLYAALGATPPTFAHASMILGPDGKRLSKRHGATSVEAFGGQGIIPEGMVNFLALLGWSLDGERELFTLAELQQVFDLSRIVPNPAVFDVAKLEWINAQHLKRLDEGERVRRVTAFLEARRPGFAARPEAWRLAFVRALGERLRTLADAEHYGAFALDDVLVLEPEAWADALGRDAGGERLAALAGSLAALPEWTLASIEANTRALAAEQGIKAGELIALARVALTGRRVAPGIFEVCLLLGRDRTLERLRAAAARWQREARSMDA